MKLGELINVLDNLVKADRHRLESEVIVYTPTLNHGRFNTVKPTDVKYDTWDEKILWIELNQENTNADPSL
jgi:hypothetical protein